MARERNFWMIGADGKVYGPADLETMARWISEGRVTATTQVAPGADGPWHDAAAIAELAMHFTPVTRGDAGAQAGAGAGSGAGAHAGAHHAGASAHAAPGAPPTEPVPGAGTTTAWEPPALVNVTLLVAGILNILWGLGALPALSVFGVMTVGLGFLCCPIALIPLVIGILQCVDYAGAARMEPQRYFDRVRMWGIFNIVLLIAGNIPVAVCGILQLVLLGEARQKAGLR